MRLLCKDCKKILTKDLYPVKDSKSLEKDDYRENPDMIDYVFKTNVFSIQKPLKHSIHCKENPHDNYQVNWKTPHRIRVSQFSINQNVIPEFKEGFGCCNWSIGEVLTCECGNKLGHMFLDCYETKEVQFIPKSVIRSY